MVERHDFVNKLVSKHNMQDIQLMKCFSCGFIFTDRVFINPEAKCKADYFGIADQSIAEWEKFRKRQKRAIYNHALSLVDFQVNSACDVGGASGLFLDEIASKFHISSESCLVVDLTPNLLEYCSNVKGYKVYNGDLHMMSSYDSYDLVTFMEVLEHVPYPKEDLSRVFSMLNPRGAVIIEVPNVLFQYYKSKVKKALNLESHGLMLHIHVNHFRPYVLKNLLATIGFREIRIFAQPSARFSNNRCVTGAKSLYASIALHTARLSGIIISPGYLAIGRKPAD